MLLQAGAVGGFKTVANYFFLNYFSVGGPEVCEKNSEHFI